jgi:hypothetical protein
MTEVREGYEFTYNPDLPPLPGWYLTRFDDSRVTWDREGNHEVDFDQLVRLGYCRRVRITESKEYI